MAYFSNGSEGSDYEEQFCSRCVHQRGCTVWLAHLLFAYGADDAQRKVLDTLIPRQGIRNLKCTMFVSAEDVKRGRKEHALAGQKRLF